MTWIIGLLTARGASPALAKAIAYAGLALLILGALWGGKCAYDRSVVNKHEQQIEKRAKPATDQAATERANDTIAIQQNETEAHNAVHSVPDAAPAGPSHALNCQRLRKLGRSVAACGGLGSGR